MAHDVSLGVHVLAHIAVGIKPLLFADFVGLDTHLYY
jgi:hypothetical protein